MLIVVYDSFVLRSFYKIETKFLLTYTVHVCDISPLRGSPRRGEMVVIDVRHKLMNVAKKVDGFSAALWPK